MAKKAKTQDEVIGDALTKAVSALPAALPWCGPKSLFTAAQRTEAEAAVAQGFFRVEKRSERKGKKTIVVEYAVPTDAGIRRVVGQGSPRAALESLAAVVGRYQQDMRPTADPQTFRDEIGKATETCVTAIRSAFDEMQAAVLKAVAPPKAPAADVGEVLAAIDAALARVEPQIVHVPTPTPAVATAPPPPPVTTAKSAASTTALEDDIVRFVDRRAQETTGGSLFDVLFAEVRAEHPTVSEGEFQDALRRLDRQQRIRLGGWPRSPHDLPVPELAMFVAHKVMYYAHPIR